MNGTQITRTGFTDDISYAELGAAGSPRSPARSFMHPDEVVSDLRLTQAEKREILACWASDVHAVANAPALRQLDNGAVVRVDDILQALKSVNDGEDSKQTTFDPFRSFAGLRTRPPARPRLHLQRGA